MSSQSSHSIYILLIFGGSEYHPKINLTIKVNPCKFLDTNIINNKDNITTEVFRKTSKLPVH